MDKIVKSKNKNKIREKVPSLYFKAAKKELVDIKINKIPKKNLKFNNSNRRFGNDITNMIKNHAQFPGFRSFHKKCSSITKKVRLNYINYLILLIIGQYSRNKNNSSV
jgi:hypothetical protein